jgi:hypothetical protein
MLPSINQFPSFAAHNPHPSSDTPNTRQRRDTDSVNDQHNDLERYDRVEGDPMNAEMQAAMFTFLQKMTPPVTLNGLREHFSEAQWNEFGGVASKELGALASTPAAKEMVEKLKSWFGGSTPRSDIQWAVAALTSLVTNGQRNADANSVAGFDLYRSNNNAATTFERFKTHLVTTGQATPELAGSVAYMLLWQSAPEFLLPNIPADVDNNSPIWKLVARETRKLEANQFQSSLTKTYDDILDILDPSRITERENQVF